MQLETDADVAARVRATLGEQRVSGAELARRLDMPQRYVARRLAGEVPFTAVELAAAAAALNVPVTRFLPAPAATA